MAINLYSKDSTDSLLAAKLSDAPIDGSTYGRKDGAWEVVGGGGSFLPLAGGTMSGAIVFDAVGLQNIAKGTFDNSTGGYNGISLTCAVGYELNWQGGHLGNWYSGAYNLITIDSPVHITHIDGLTVESGMTVKGPIISDQSATSGFTTTFNGDGLQMGGGQYISQEESVVSGFNINLQASGTVNNIGTLTFSDSTTQTTAASPFNGGTVTAPVVVDESATSGFTTTYSGATISMGGGSMYISQEESLVSGFNVQLPVSGSITFGDSTTQSSAGVSSDKAIANAFAASMWYASDGYDMARNGVVNTNYIGGYYLSAGISDGTTFAAGFPATNATLDTGSYWYVSINGTLSDLFIFSP